jgi:hypothetical protein
MKNSVLDLFTDSSQKLIQYHFPELVSGFKSCWYPSAGNDFRPLAHISDNSPILYLFNDMATLDNSFYGEPNPIFEQGEFKGHLSYVKSEILWYWPLEFKLNLWNPNTEILECGETEVNKLKGFLFKVKVEERIIPLIYITIENTNFFFDYLLFDEIRIDFLVHVNDGGASLGTSRVKMDYIYLHLDVLGINEIWVDYTFETKKRHIENFIRFNPYSFSRFRNRSFNVRTVDSEVQLRRIHEKFMEIEKQEEEYRKRRRELRDFSVADSRIENLFSKWQLVQTTESNYCYQYRRIEAM